MSEDVKPPSDSGSVASHCSAASRIAAELLTVWGGDQYRTECDRAQMMLRQSDGTERNMGGRNKRSIADTIDGMFEDIANEIADAIKDHVVGEIGKASSVSDASMRLDGSQDYRDIVDRVLGR